MSEKTVRKKTTIFTKRNSFFAGYIVFLLFCDKKRAKVRFQTKFQEKPSAKTRKLLQNVTVYLQSASCFYSCFFDKKTANVRFQTEIEGKPHIIERQVS